MGQDDSSEIYSIDIDGTNLTRVTTNGVYDHPVQWSPDNTKLLTYSNSAFNYYFYLLINLNGDVLGQVNLFANPGGAAFSPDGAKIIYSDNSYGSPQMSFVYDVSSGNRTHLYCNDSDFYSLDFSWSSDSSKVVFPLMNAGMRVLHMNSGDCTVISVPGTPQTPKWMP
jgi:Tol biopolymer transport system component